MKYLSFYPFFFLIVVLKLLCLILFSILIVFVLVHKNHSERVYIPLFGQQTTLHRARGRCELVQTKCKAIFVCFLVSTFVLCHLLPSCHSFPFLLIRFCFTPFRLYGAFHGLSSRCFQVSNSTVFGWRSSVNVFNHKNYPNKIQ